MKSIFSRWTIFTVILVMVIVAAYRLIIPEPKIDFSSQVKPILNKNCITCHGGVKAKKGFSFLFRDEAMAKTESGRPAIIPGDPENSEMIRRLSLKDPEERMPYKHEALSKEDISILTQWVKEGAVWGDHWAYLPVKPVEKPEIENKWIRNDIDRFILSKIESEKLTPSPEAPKEVLLRRLGLDLIGTLPSPALSNTYLHSTEPRAYEKLVDSLLASPLYGERWASMWLDISRYSDTKGYEADGGRNIWKYRDWIIKAFNEDKPYDKFLTEQIAGDLLPNPTDAQYIATGFSRNSMNNDEGGTSNEEYRTVAVLDRVNTTWEALMSTTFSCVQCHSHPYDPFKHDEYYKFMAYFNNTRDEDVPGDFPLLRELDDTAKKEVAALTQWVSNHSTSVKANATNQLLRTLQPAYYSYTADSLYRSAVVGNNADLMLQNHGYARLRKVDLDGKERVIWRYYTRAKGGTLTLRLDDPQGKVIARQTLDKKNTEGSHTLILDIPLQAGFHDLFISYENPNYKKDDEGFLINLIWFIFAEKLPGEHDPAYAENKKIYDRLLTEEVNGVPVMLENPESRKRKSNVFERGSWISKGKEVEADVPNSLKFAMPANAPKNRLGLAMWMTDKKNPLVSRTMVNRMWEQLFGTGIVETLEDMGTQGLAPTHQALLDHVSWKFMNDYQWSVKKLLKEYVMSATYRQQSKISPELNKSDPYNKLYARGPRIRLSAEQLRDQGLSVSGTLSAKMFGPGVMPWQPQGIWLSPYNSAQWINAEGEDRYRRAVYTYWKRSAPYPSALSFDGAQRVVCNARRIRTNTPLQALVTLNDSAYVDMAQHFARRMKKEAGDNIDSQIEHGYELMLYKKIPSGKLKVFVDLYNTALKGFNADKEKTTLMTGDSTNADPKQAALFVVANAMLNLDEVIMKN